MAFNIEPSKQQLPRGKHGLPRETVTGQQRDRILTAMVGAVAGRGYSETRVVDVISAAGVSRKTFYELFDDKDDCFLAAYDESLALLLAVTREGFDASPEAPWAARVRDGLHALLEHLAANPKIGRFCVVEAMGAGPRALARRDAAMRQFSEFLDAGRARGTSELPGITSLALVGGVFELLYTEILHGATAHLPDRLPDLVYWLVLPFQGAESAAHERMLARESLRAVPRSKRRQDMKAELEPILSRRAA